MARKQPETRAEHTEQPLSMTFEGLPEQIMPDQPWTMIRLPGESVRFFKTRASVRVYVRIGREEFRTSIMPTGDGHHHLMFNKAMQKAAVKIGWKGGEQLELSIGPDIDFRPETPMPKELETALSADEKAKALFKKLAISHRREYIRYVSEAKKEGTRQRRAIRCVESVLKKRKPDF